MRLDRDLAEQAVDRLATRLGMTRHETAAGISTVVDAKMAAAFVDRFACGLIIGREAPVSALPSSNQPS